MNIITALKKYFAKPEVKVGQRYQWSPFYNEPVNPFDPKSGKYFIMTILDIKDEWMEYKFEDGSVGSDRISKVYSDWTLLADGEKE